jgi:hypothetical protein
MNVITIIINGEFYKKENHHHLWCGDGSIVSSNGSIINFIMSVLKDNFEKHAIKSIFLPINTDGNVQEDIIKPHLDYLREENINIEDYKLIIGTLCQRTESINLNYLYIPLDDYVFEHGYKYEVEPYFLKWEDKISKAFWRGECSGTVDERDEIKELVRIRTVRELLDFELADVKMTNAWGWANGKNVPQEYFVSSRISYQEMFKYKIFMIIDGNVIASNHMWGFATGCVPVIISNAKCWFIEYLEPFVNYIPIKYDLSDLKDKIRWIIDNDEKAKEIANNAFKFSKEIFSPSFQQKYLNDKINEILK